MKTIELTLARIGNSRGIRLPADMIRRHGLESGMVLEDRGNEIVLRPKAGLGKLSWEETAREIAAAKEDHNEWDITMADGLETIPWDQPPLKSSRPKRKSPKSSAKKP
jgi:antitoxin component of MazEF toxin-antitoxin module